MGKFALCSRARRAWRGPLGAGDRCVNARLLLAAVSSQRDGTVGTWSEARHCSRERLSHEKSQQWVAPSIPGDVPNLSALDYLGQQLVQFGGLSETLPFRVHSATTDIVFIDKLPDGFTTKAYAADIRRQVAGS